MRKRNYFIIISVLSLLVLLFVPLVIDFLFWLGNILPFAIPISFDREAILAYTGGALLPLLATVVLGFIVYKQTERLDAIDAKISKDSFAYETFTYLTVDELKLSKTRYPVTTPSDSPNKILTFDLLENILPSELKKFKNGFEVVADWGNAKIKMDLSAGSTSRNLIMYPTCPPFRGKYLFCTPMVIKFFATPSKNFYVRKMKLTKFGFTLMKTGRTQYGFYADIKAPITVEILQDTYEDNDVCRYTFQITAYLLHDILDLRENDVTDNITFEIEASYENILGVEAHCQQIIGFEGVSFVNKRRVNPPFVKDIKIVTSKN